MYNCNNPKQNKAITKEMFVANSIYHSNTVYNCFKQLKLRLFLSNYYIDHLMTITTSTFLDG